jgi:hypothetical protein
MRKSRVNKEFFMKLYGPRRLAMCLAFLMVAVLAIAGSPKGNYRLLKKVDFGAAPGGREYFDYITVDPSARRVYLSHGTEVKVVDADSGNAVGTVSDLKNDHGIALIKELGKGFISDGGGNRVVIFEMQTLNVTGEVKAGGNPDCIIYDPASKHIFTFNGNTKDSTAIDPANGTVVGTVPMGGRPESAVADGKGMIYDNIEDTNEVVALDSRALTIKARWPIAPAATPTAMAMDQEHRRLFIGGRNKILAIMNADNGMVVQTFPIGDGVDANIYDNSTRLLYVSTREGIVHIFHEDSPDKFREVETVKTEFGAKTMALDPKTHNLYLTTANFGPPPAPTAEEPRPNPVPVPGTFRLLIYGH